MPIILPKKIAPVETTLNEPLFFLVGPILGARDWQAHMAEEILKHNPNAFIACPSWWTENHWLSAHFMNPYTKTGVRQLHWERYYIKQAGYKKGVHGCIIAWLPEESASAPHPGPGPYAVDTRRKLGKFAGLMEAGVKLRLVLGGSKNFPGLDTLLEELRLASKKKKIDFYTDMKEIVYKAQHIARRNF